MGASQSSRRDVFRRLAESPLKAWPAYDSTPLYDRTSLGALEEDVRTVARVWFEHDAHELLAEFVCQLPLAYVDFEPHDQYALSRKVEMEQAVRLFMVASAWGIEGETTVAEFLRERPLIREWLGFESVPDQSTLWRTWNERFSRELREAVSRCGVIALVKAERAGISTPRDVPEPDLEFSEEKIEKKRRDRVIGRFCRGVQSWASKCVG